VVRLLLTIAPLLPDTTRADDDFVRLQTAIYITCGREPVRSPLAPVHEFSAQNWTATPTSRLTWLAGGRVTENLTPKSLKVKSSV